MPASPVPGSRPRASSPGAHRPAAQHRVAAHPASGLNHTGCVMPAHAAGRQPGPRPASQPASTGGGDHRDRQNTTSRACCPASPGRDHRPAAEAAGPGAGRHRHSPADGCARPDHRGRRAAAHPGRARLFRVEPGVGRERLRGGVRRAAAARRKDRRPTGAPPDPHRRAADLLPRVAARRAGHRPGVADRRPGRAGRRRGNGRAHRAVAGRRHLPGGPGRATARSRFTRRWPSWASWPG